MRGPLKSLANRRPLLMGSNFGPLLSAAALSATVLLAACAAPTTKPQTQAYSQPQFELEEPIAYTSCVPYARSVSGVQLFGDAWTWWKGADGKYAKGVKPTKGSVLTLTKTKSLPMGHVAVVAALSEDPRKLWVDHANWGDNGNTRGKIHKRQPVIDVSANNDWSEVRFMNTVGTFGRVYPAQGFIYAEAPKPVQPPESKPLPPTRTASNNSNRS